VADSLPRFRGRVEKIKSNIARAAAVAALRGGTVIQLRAKEILIQNRHYITGTLHRSITVSLIEVNKYGAAVAIGTQVIYGKYVERLDDGGYLFRAAEEKLAEALRVAGASLDQAIKAGAK